MKFLDILTTASSNMLRSKVRSFLTIVAVFVGAFTITLTVGISGGISSYIDNQLGNIGAEDVLIVQGKTDIGPTSSESGPKKYDPDRNLASSGQPGPAQVVLTTKDIDTIKSQPGILSAKPLLSTQTDYIQADNSDKYEISVSQFVDGTNLVLAAGGSVANTASENQIILPLTHVGSLGFGSAAAAVGKTVTIAVTDSLGDQHTVEAKVAGVQEETLISATGASINTTLANSLNDLQSIGLPEAAKDKHFALLARFDKNISQEELQSIKDSLSDQGYSAMTIQDQIGTFKQVINAITYVLIFFGAIALLAASFGIINTLYMAVQERTKEIGLMKAMGMRSSKIFTLFSVEAILLGFWGSVLGILAAIGAGQLVNKIASDTFLKDLQGFDLTSFSIQSLAIIVVLIMGIAFLAGTLPAKRAAKQSPIDALRYE